MIAAEEPLTWGVVANVSRDVLTRQRTDAKRPGTRHFAPGAKVWILPIRWGTAVSSGTWSAPAVAPAGAASSAW